MINLKNKQGGAAMGIIIAIILLLILAVLVYVFVLPKYQDQENEDSKELSANEEIFGEEDEKGEKEEKDKKEAPTKTEEKSSTEETDKKEITLEDVSEELEVSGRATRKIIGDKFVHTVTAQLPAPEEGFFYEGWLIRKLPFHYISSGKLIKGDDGAYILTFESDTDYKDHPEVVITLEPVDDNPSPSDVHLLEGYLGRL